MKRIVAALAALSCGLSAQADTRISFVPHPCGKSGKIVFISDHGDGKNPLTVKVADVSCRLPMDYGGQKYGTQWKLSDAVLSLGGAGLWGDKIWGRPNPAFIFRGDPKPAKELLDSWTNYPPASAKRYVFDFVDRPEGGWRIFVNGNYYRDFSHNAMKHKMLSVEPDMPSEWEVKTDHERHIDWNARYQVCDLSLNPMLGRSARDVRTPFGEAALVGLKPGPVTFGGVPFCLAAPRDAGDVGRTMMKQGTFMLEVNPYRMRTTREAYPYEVHFRVAPAADYVTAHVLFALDPDPAAPREMTVRLGPYMNEASAGGSGANAWTETRVVCGADGLPKGAEKVGEVEAAGKRVGLYRLAVSLELGPIADLLPKRGCIDLDFLGGRPGEKGSRSAFSIFGATLEAAPFDVAFKQAAPGNVFCQDEPAAARTTAFELKARAAAQGEVRWTAKDDAGREVLTGRAPYDLKAAGEKATVTIPLDAASAVGVYTLDVDFGPFAHTARFAVVPGAQRAMTAETCPYGTGAFSAHMAWMPPRELAMLHRKAGIYKAAPWLWTDRTGGGEGVEGLRPAIQLGVINHIRAKFDPKTETFGIGEEAMVADIRNQLKTFPFADTALIWHETAPYFNGTPEELTGKPIPAAKDSDLAAGKYVNACGRLFRKYFPNIKLQIGNSGLSLGAAVVPFRGGAKGEYYDYLGIEWPGQSCPPDHPNGLLAMLNTQKCASFHAGRTVPLNSCWESSYRSTHSTSIHTISEDAQAQFYVRDILVQLVHGFRLINPGNMIDARNTYHDSFWGSSGICFAAPACYPKLAYVAYAVLTKMLDGVTFSRLVDVGRRDIFAAEFKRADGKLVTVVWCCRGTGIAEVPSGAAEEAFSMRGKVLDATRVTFGEEPSYIVSAKPLEGVRVTERRFPVGERLCRGGVGVRAQSVRLTAADVECKRPVRDVEDPEIGACIEIPIAFTEKEGGASVGISFKKPIPLVENAGVVGLRLTGDASCGAITYAVVDSTGKRFTSYMLTDGAGFSCRDFEGWGYIYYALSRNRLIFGVPYGSADKALLGKPVPPLKLVGVTIGCGSRAVGLKGPREPIAGEALRIAEVFSAAEVK